MKNRDIIKSLQRAFDLDNTKEKKAALKKALKKLKKKQIKFKRKLEDAKSSLEKSKIEAKLKINQLHRKKGMKALRELDGKK